MPPTPQAILSSERAAPLQGVRHWPTWAVLGLCYAVLALALWLPAGTLGVQLVLLVFALTLHSSVTHEILHGGLCRRPWANAVIGVVQPGLLVPYLRFRALHLAHHNDGDLTDPYDDPESHYLDPAVWARLGRGSRAVLRFNNTLLGRMLVGPVIGMAVFLLADLRRMQAGARDVMGHWAAHLPGVGLTLWAVSLSSVPLWAYLGACYGAMSVLRIRTFLEHRAHERVAGRSVVIEDRGILSFLFLNNNLHMLHHMHPQVPWYRLPALYRQRRAQVLRCNDGYVYRSYRHVFARYFLRAKDPVAHPLWRDRGK